MGSRTFARTSFVPSERVKILSSVKSTLTVRKVPVEKICSAIKKMAATPNPTRPSLRLSRDFLGCAISYRYAPFLRSTTTILAKRKTPMMLTKKIKSRISITPRIIAS